MATIVNKYTLGRGEIHLAAFAPGTTVAGGFRYIGNSPNIGYTVTAQELDHFGSDHGVAELDFSIATNVTRAGSFTTDNVDRDNTALFFFGSKATVTSTSATAVSETFADVIHGLSYQLGVTNARPAGVRNLANVTVTVGVTAKTLGTDYTVDLQRGLVYIVPGGTIASGTADIIVAYDQVASSYDQVLSGNTPFEGAMLYLADNPAGPNTDFLLPWIRLTPNGEFALKAENALQALPFNLKILKVPGKAAVYANGQPYTA